MLRQWFRPFWSPSSFLLVVGVVILTSTTTTTLVSAQECTPCFDATEEPDTFDITRPGAETPIKCSEVTERAQSVTGGTDECLSFQLTTYQASCCISVPDDYCTMCPGGSTNFAADKTIPQGPMESIEFTCLQVATGRRFLSGTPPGDCDGTERARAASWCECNGRTNLADAPCSLTCPGTNSPPPDLSLMDPVFNKSCERFMYEYSTLTAEECPMAAIIFNFDAIAFCCPDVDPPSTCDACPIPGATASDPNKAVQTEFFGTVTCSEIDLHARHVPDNNDACQELIFELDLRDGEDCCDVVGETPSSTAGQSAESATQGGDSGTETSDGVKGIPRVPLTVWSSPITRMILMVTLIVHVLPP